MQNSTIDKITKFLRESLEDGLKMIRDELPPNPSMADVSKAYRKLSQLHHPDRGGNLRTMQDINVAKDYIVKYPSAIGDSGYGRNQSYRTNTSDVEKSALLKKWTWAKNLVMVSFETERIIYRLNELFPGVKFKVSESMKPFNGDLFFHKFYKFDSTEQKTHHIQLAVTVQLDSNSTAIKYIETQFDGVLAGMTYDLRRELRNQDNLHSMLKPEVLFPESEMKHYQGRTSKPTTEDKTYSWDFISHLVEMAIKNEWPYYKTHFDKYFPGVNIELTMYKEVRGANDWTRLITITGKRIKLEMNIAMVLSSENALGQRKVDQAEVYVTGTLNGKKYTKLKKDNSSNNLTVLLSPGVLFPDESISRYVSKPKAANNDDFFHKAENKIKWAFDKGGLLNKLKSDEPDHEYIVHVTVDKGVRGDFIEMDFIIATKDHDISISISVQVFASKKITFSASGSIYAKHLHISKETSMIDYIDGLMKWENILNKKNVLG